MLIALDLGLDSLSKPFDKRLKVLMAILLDNSRARFIKQRRQSTWVSQVQKKGTASAKKRYPLVFRTVVASIFKKRPIITRSKEIKMYMEIYPKKLRTPRIEKHVGPLVAIFRELPNKKYI